MSNLPTNYVDDVLNADVNTRRKYQMIQNGDGTVSLVDVTDYDTVGSSIGAAQINAQNTQINQNTEDISSLNQHLTDLTVHSTTAKIIGKDANGRNLYQKIFKGSSLSNGYVLDANLTLSNVNHYEVTGCFGTNANLSPIPYDSNDNTHRYRVYPAITSSGLVAVVENLTVVSYYFIVQYTIN